MHYLANFSKTNVIKPTNAPTEEGLPPKTAPPRGSCIITRMPRQSLLTFNPISAKGSDDVQCRGRVLGHKNKLRGRDLIDRYYKRNIQIVDPSNLLGLITLSI